jgi:transcriptional regulator with XRE-family HTH domain
MPMMTGKELRALRRGLGMTQAGFAAALGISVSQLHNYEAGRERHSGEPLAVPQLVMLAARWLAHELPAALPPRPGRRSRGTEPTGKPL